MKTNEILRKEVQDSIRWEPLLNTTDIGVIVSDGIVTLTGRVDSYYKKKEAEKTAKNIGGVKAVVDDIEVIIDKERQKNDTDIAIDVINALHHNWSVPDEKIKVTVDNGWVTLEGILKWEFEREAAQNAIKYLQGIRGVTNKLKLQSTIDDAIEKKHVEAALRRNWSIDCDKINVRVLGNMITLSGVVNSIYQKEAAERITYKTPGVWFVENLLEVRYNHTD